MPDKHQQSVAVAKKQVTDMNTKQQCYFCFCLLMKCPVQFSQSFILSLACLQKQLKL